MKDDDGNISDESGGAVELLADTVEQEVSSQIGAAMIGLEMEAPLDVEIGVGFDFITGWVNPLNVALVEQNGDRIRADSQNMYTLAVDTGGSFYKTVSDEESYQKSMSASATLTASYWGIKASSSVSAMASTKASSTSVATFIQTVLYGTAHVLNDVSLSATSLSEKARAVLLQGGLLQATEETLKAFIASYGTHYVKGFLYGGTFTGSVTVESSSTEDHAQLAVALTVSGSGASAEAKFSESLDEVQKTHKVTVTTSATGAIILGTPTDVAGILDANRKFAEDVEKTGGTRIIAFLAPWGNAAPFSAVVPHDLIQRYLNFGNINDELRVEARENFARLSYIRNCIQAYSKDYAPDGSWSFYLAYDNTVTSGDIKGRLDALEKARLAASAALDALSLDDLAGKNADPPSPGFGKLRAAMENVNREWEDLQSTIKKRTYLRNMTFQFYDKNGNEKDGVIRQPSHLICYPGHEDGTERVVLLKHPDESRLYEVALRWTPMRTAMLPAGKSGARTGCYFRLESGKGSEGATEQLLQNTDREELVLTNKSYTGGPLKVRWSS